jgi:hypothetical protein
MPTTSPRLRTVDKYAPPYPLNRFPTGFPVGLGREIVYLLATRKVPRLEGNDWEEIFAAAVGADWKPSNVGLDDVVLEQTAWGAKTVKNKQPSTARRVRLISGRNSPVFSFGDSAVAKRDPAELGAKILEIWNERVAAVRKLFRHVRTVVLIKSDDLREVAVFETDTVIYQRNQFIWQWNDHENLEGMEVGSKIHRFTWQPHGSQFTIIEDVPEDRLAIRIKAPPKLKKDDVLDAVKFDPSWVTVL